MYEDQEYLSENSDFSFYQTDDVEEVSEVNTRDVVVENAMAFPKKIDFMEMVVDNLEKRQTRVSPSSPLELSTSGSASFVRIQQYPSKSTLAAPQIAFETPGAPRMGLQIPKQRMKSLESTSTPSGNTFSTQSNQRSSVTSSSSIYQSNDVHTTSPSSSLSSSTVSSSDHKINQKDIVPPNNRNVSTYNNLIESTSPTSSKSSSPKSLSSKSLSPKSFKTSQSGDIQMNQKTGVSSSGGKIKVQKTIKPKSTISPTSSKSSSPQSSSSKSSSPKSSKASGTDIQMNTKVGVTSSGGTIKVPKTIKPKDTTSPTSSKSSSPKSSKTSQSDDIQMNQKAGVSSSGGIIKVQKTIKPKDTTSPTSSKSSSPKPSSPKSSKTFQSDDIQMNQKVGVSSSGGIIKVQKTIKPKSPTQKGLSSSSSSDDIQMNQKVGVSSSGGIIKVQKTIKPKSPTQKGLSSSSSSDDIQMNQKVGVSSSGGIIKVQKTIKPKSPTQKGLSSSSSDDIQMNQKVGVSSSGGKIKVQKTIKPKSTSPSTSSHDIQMEEKAGVTSSGGKIKLKKKIPPHLLKSKTLEAVIALTQSDKSSTVQFQPDAEYLGNIKEEGFDLHIDPLKHPVLASIASYEPDNLELVVRFLDRFVRLVNVGHMRGTSDEVKIPRDKFQNAFKTMFIEDKMKKKDKSACDNITTAMNQTFAVRIMTAAAFCLKQFPTLTDKPDLQGFVNLVDAALKNENDEELTE